MTPVLRITATESGVAAFFKEGRPIPAALAKREEPLRLPVFVSVKAVPVKDYGLTGAGRIVVGVARKDVWFAHIIRGKAIVAEDVTLLAAMADAVGKSFKGRTVTGWLISTEAVTDELAVLAAAAGGVATGKALLR